MPDKSLPGRSQTLVVCDQLPSETTIVHILDGTTGVDGVNGCGGSALAEDHEYWLHANRAVGDV